VCKLIGTAIHAVQADAYIAYHVTDAMTIWYSPVPTEVILHANTIMIADACGRIGLMVELVRIEVGHCVAPVAIEETLV